MSTDKKIMLVTGANSGIGYETSFALANASPSHHVIMTARSASKGQAALSALQDRKPAGSLSFLELDLTSDESISAAVSSLTSEHGRLDVLVNNAGVADDYPLKTTERQPVERDSALHIYNTNALGPLLLTQALEPLLRKSGDARVINVSTTLGSVALRADHTDPNAPVQYEGYRMSKAALNMATMSTRYYLRDFAKVWAFCPGLVVTNLSGEGDHETRKEFGASLPSAPAAVILDIVNGKKDDQTDQFINISGGTYPW